MGATSGHGTASSILFSMARYVFSIIEFGVEFIVLKVCKKRKPWRLRRTINRIVYDGNGCEEVRNHRAVVGFELPFPYDACIDN